MFAKKCAWDEPGISFLMISAENFKNVYIIAFSLLIFFYTTLLPKFSVATMYVIKLVCFLLIVDFALCICKAY